MRKYKHNYIFSVAFKTCTYTLNISPMFLIAAIGKSWEEFLEGIFFCVCIVLFFTIFGTLLHCVISIFTKHAVFIDDKTITLKDKSGAEQSINIDDVRYIVFDDGGRWGTSLISIINSDGSQKLHINDPSFLMIVEVLKRCKKAKFSDEDFKIRMGFLIFAIVAGIIMSNYM